MAYHMVATAVTLNDLEGHSPVADVFTCNPSNICAAFYTISPDSVFARFLCISRASCIIGSNSLHCIQSGGLWRVFFGYISPDLNGSGWNPEYKWGVRFALTQKIRGKSPQGLHLRMPKGVLFLSPIQCGLSATYPAPILTAFEIKDVNQCPHA